MANLWDKSVLRPEITNAEFFAWFANQTSCDPPDGPAVLKCTLKDAMPISIATEILRGSEGHFAYMRKDIKAQCEKATEFMPDLKEFVVLVTVPGWESPDIGGEDW